MTAVPPVAARPSDPVRLIMASTVASVDAGTSVVDAAAELTADEIGAVLVTGAGPVGVLTERDVLTLVGTGADLSAAQAGDVMTPDVIWADPDDTIASAGRQMLDAGVRHLLVGDGHRVAGVVSLRDVAAVVVPR